MQSTKAKKDFSCPGCGDLVRKGRKAYETEHGLVCSLPCTASANLGARK